MLKTQQTLSPINFVEDPNNPFTIGYASTAGWALNANGGGGGSGTFYGTNGLSSDGNAIKLGGSLIEDVYIDGAFGIGIGFTTPPTYIDMTAIDLAYLGATGGNVKVTTDYAQITNSSIATLIFNDVGTSASFIDHRATKKGLEYANDYSNSFSNRSLVDKAFVYKAIGEAGTNGGGSITASNGLTKIGDDIQLGGDISTYPVIIGQTNEPQIVFDNDNSTFTGYGVNLFHGQNNFSAYSWINAGYNGSNSYSNTLGSKHSNSTSESQIFTIASNTSSNIGISTSWNSFNKSVSLNFVTDNTVNTAKFSGSTGFKGVEYENDYSNNYSNRSLVDRQYVTNQISYASTAGNVTASNGLTKTGNNIKFGGTLIEDTTISGNFTLNLLNSNIQTSSTTRTGWGGAISPVTSHRFITVNTNDLVGMQINASNLTSSLTNTLQVNSPTSSSSFNPLGSDPEGNVVSYVQGANRIGFTFRPANKFANGMYLQSGSYEGILDYDGYLATISYHSPSGMTGNTNKPLLTINKNGIRNSFDHTGSFIELKNVLNATGDFITISGPSSTLFRIRHDGTITSNGTAGASFNFDNNGLLINGTLINNSAIFQTDSTSKGILIPRLTSTERNAIGSPANGLMVYNTTTVRPNWYSGTNGWVDHSIKRTSYQNITGSVTIDLSIAEMFILTLTGNVTSFAHTNSTVGKEYTFIFLKGTTQYTLTWATGMYRFPFGNAPVLTDPTTNGTSPASSKDIITALCSEIGYLDVVFTPDLIKN